MTIPAVRFENLTSDFNIASKSFSSIKDAAILNAPEVANIKDAISSAKDLISQLKELENEAVDETRDLIKNATRQVEDIYNTFVDITKLPGDFINEKLQEFFPEDLGQITNAIKNMTTVCRNNALGNSLGFGKLKPSDCGNGLSIGNCPPSSAKNVLGKALTNGVNSIAGMAQNLLGKVMALANIGFNANLCGVFSAVMDTVSDLPVIGTAAALLGNQQGSKGNLNAVFDIAKTVAAKDINIAAIIPSTVSNIVAGVKSMDGVKQEEKQSIWASLQGSLETFDKNWLSSSDGISSIEKIKASSKSVIDFIGDSLKSNDFTDLNSVPDNQPAFIALQAV